jgi:hypothetical protein
VPAIVALVLASSAKRNIAASNGALTGEQLAQVAKILAWINIGLAIVATVFFVVVAIVAGTNDDSNTSLGALVSLAAI